MLNFLEMFLGPHCPALSLERKLCRAWSKAGISFLIDRVGPRGPDVTATPHSHSSREREK